jgi:AcrR family transcriptional regulator
VNIRDEVAALKRERTISDAANFFYEKGYDNTTLDQVAESLGVAKPFIYANFGSKSKLLAEICERGVRAALDEVEDALSQNLAPTQTLQLFARRYVAAILANQKNIAIYTREEKNLEPVEAERIGTIRRTFSRKLAELLRKGAETGEFRISDPTVAALAIIGAVSWSTFWYRPTGRLGVSDIATEMVGCILGLAGATTEPSETGVGRAIA